MDAIHPQSVFFPFNMTKIHQPIGEGIARLFSTDENKGFCDNRGLPKPQCYHSPTTLTKPVTLAVIQGALSANIYERFVLDYRKVDVYKIKGLQMGRRPHFGTMAETPVQESR